MAFYLKYRPQTIGELDIAAVREGLLGVLKAQTLPHALLFAGPRGTGKTSAARILAKAINCERRVIATPAKGGAKQSRRESESATSSLRNPSTALRSARDDKNTEPCNSCAACQSITAGRALDVMEIDAASHRGIDDIRDLRDKVRLAPTELRYKVYIIDEVHMLTTEAFNALLKTLEEPPKNVIFVLCTTELHKVPATIVSRCVRIPFQKGTPTDIVRALQRVATGEGLDIEETALQTIAEKVDGSFRDAHKMLEQLSWVEEKITLDKVKELIGMSDERVNEVINLINQKNTRSLIQLIEEMVGKGEKVRVVWEGVLNNLHAQLLENYGVQDIKNQELNITDLSDLIKKLSQALYEMKTSVIEQLPIELAILEWESRIQNSEFRNSNEKSPAATSSVSPSLVKEGVRSSPMSAQTEWGSLSIAASNQENNRMISVNRLTPPAPPLKKGGEIESISLDSLQQRWAELLEALKPKNHSVQALLRSAKPKAVSGNRVMIEVWYPFHFDKLNAMPQRQIVEQTICDVWGCQTVRVEYILGQRAAQTPHTNGNMLAEEDIPQRSFPAKQVSDQGRNSYSVGTRFPRSAAGRDNYTSPTGVPASASTEDDALIKFAEEIFGK